MKPRTKAQATALAQRDADKTGKPMYIFNTRQGYAVTYFDPAVYWGEKFTGTADKIEPI